MPKNDQIRHNDLTERHLEETEKLSPRELFARTAGESHKDDFRTENVQLSSAKGWQLFLLAVPVGLMVLCLALLLWR